MPQLRQLSLTRALMTPAFARRAALLGMLALCERLLAPATAWLLFHASLGTKLAASASLGATLAMRGFVERVASARTEADLLVRVVEALLEGDILKANVLPDEDARVEVAQAVFQVAQTVTRTWPTLLADIVASAVLAFVVLSLEPWPVAAFAVAITVAAAGALFVSRRSLRRLLARAWRAQERVHASLVDAIEGRLEIVAAGRDAAFRADMAQRARTWAAESVHVASSSIVSGRLPMLGLGGLVAALVLTAGSRWGLPVSLANVALLATATPAFAGVAQELVALTQTEPWLRTIARILTARRPAFGGTSACPERPRRIAFEGVSFRYDEADGDGDALREVSFSTDQQVVALAGPNGSGKSTCLRLLLGLAPPRAGRIVVDGAQLSEMTLDSWRARVAFLPQRAYLPPRSDLRAAMRLLAPEATDETLLAALDRVGLLNALRRAGASPLDIGVDTLSVGQRQRVGLARMLCRDASVYLLDEPDANLDRDGITLVAGVVRELARESTVIVAAHTRELLEEAKQVIVLEEGRVVSRT
jgi:ABC-type multidrug transport system fused ATPase/permease subunit